MNRFVTLVTLAAGLVCLNACATVTNEVHDWEQHGVKIVHGSDLDVNTAQTPGMTRAAAINYATAGASKLWAGSVELHPDAKASPHHHGKLESIIYVVSGRSRTRWGDNLEFVAEAGPGDFLFIPPYCPHQEINASKDEPLVIVVVRSDQEPIVVNLDIPSPEGQSQVSWVDPLHQKSE